ncbi:MAG TPA: hypothetical protein VF273_01210 [Pelobium sp.]
MPSTKKVEDEKMKNRKQSAVSVTGLPKKSATAKRAEKKTDK